MNYFRRRLLFSFLILFLTLPVFYFLSTQSKANPYGVELFFLSVFIMLLCLAYILWFYFSLGKLYSGDFDRLIHDPDAITKAGWAIPEKEWGAYTRQLLEDFNAEARTSAARDFKSCGYWIVNLAFAPIVLLSLLAAYWGYWGALWMVPVPLFFMWVANINILRFVSPLHNRRQIRRWQKQAGGRFVFGEYGYILGEDYFPLLGRVFWYDHAGVSEKENGKIFLKIESLKKLERGSIINHRVYQIPVPQEHLEKARSLANFIALQGKVLTLRFNSKNASLPARDKRY